MSDQVSGDTGRTERAKAQRAAREAFVLAIGRGGSGYRDASAYEISEAIYAACDAFVRARAPEPSGVPPDVKDALDAFAAVMQAVHPDVGERQRRQRAARDAVLSAIRATTEVERVARATLDAALDEPHPANEAERKRIVARVIARLGATPKEDAR